MNKIIIILLVFFSFSNCAALHQQMLDANMRRNVYSMYNGLYIRDMNTGLCFMMIDAYQGASIACVPCDSLKKLDVKNIYILRRK